SPHALEESLAGEDDTRATMARERRRHASEDGARKGLLLLFFFLLFLFFFFFFPFSPSFDSRNRPSRSILAIPPGSERSVY
ncbi:hypothetical protein GW17_00030304, partial [Ensete ventricosum]